MFSKISILLTLIILKIVSGQEQIFRYGVKYRRNEELSNAPPQPHQLKANPNANVQLLIPGRLPLSDAPGDAQELGQMEGPDKEPHANDGRGKIVLKPEHASFNYKDAKLPSHKVNYVQEKTAGQWPMGVVPYFIDTEIYDPTTIRRVVNTMAIVESSSCVLFKELEKKPTDSNDAWLYISNPQRERECVHEFSSDDDGGTVVVLGFECLHPNEILHSLLHAIGLKDEVSHPHRDQYIRIQWDNIQPKYRHLFRIQFEDTPYKLVEYDPMSIMHFHDRAFSANGAATIVPMISGLQIGPTNTLSQLDIMKLKLAFGHECNKRKVGGLLDTCKNALSSKKLVAPGVAEEANDKKNESAIYEENSPESSQQPTEEGHAEDDHDAEQLDTEDDNALLVEEAKTAPMKQLEASDDTERKPQKFMKYGTGHK